MKNFLIYIFLSVIPIVNLSGLQISKEHLHTLAQKIWKNECGGTLEGLTTWNKGEEFGSFGIGHFIWYPEGVPQTFYETFPALVQYLKKNCIATPQWMEGSCPWKNREDFYSHIQSLDMQNLRKYLAETKDLQALFIAQRLENTLSKMDEVLDKQEAEKIKHLIVDLMKDPRGLYALIDYVNFKGEGLLPQETYQGQGWGLLQVLQEIPAHSSNLVLDFVQAGQRVLKRRVDNSPAERHEQRWLQGWINRLQTYLD